MKTHEPTNTQLSLQDWSQGRRKVEKDDHAGTAGNHAEGQKEGETNLPKKGQQGFQKKLDMHPGDTFGRWTLISEIHRGRSILWNCLCECGKELPVNSTALRTGKSKSCGCMRTEMTVARSTTHGHAPRSGSSPTLRTWTMMINRCTNPKCDKWHRYGGRGISVCQRWMESFENFLADMGERPEGMTIDRRENDGNYEPGNCRWATRAQQMNNRTNSRFLSLGDRRQTLAEWAKELGIGNSTLWQRLKAGWSEYKTLTIPIS